MERRSICSAAASQHKLDEAPETFKQGFHEIKSQEGLHTACMLGQRNISGVPDLRQIFRIKMKSRSSNEPSVLHQALANNLCVY